MNTYVEAQGRKRETVCPDLRGISGAIRYSIPIGIIKKDDNKRTD